MIKKQKLQSLEGREFMLTDQCWFQEENNDKDYNPDDRRKPHMTAAIDLETGTVRMVKSGSIIRIVKDASK